MKKQTGYVSIDKPQNNGYDFWKIHPIIPNTSIYTAMCLLSSFYNQKEAIDCLELHANYGTLKQDAITISLALKELGIKKGDIVSVSMPNFYQAVASFFACNRIGAVATFLDPSSSDYEINEYLNEFESSVFINYNKGEEENKQIKKKTSVRYIITLDKNKVNSLNIKGNYRIISNDNKIDFHSLESISEFQKKKIEFVFGNDNALILFTSGTTGKSKSVVLTNENVLAAGTYLKNSSKIKNLKGDRTLVCVPFSYPYGFATSTLMSLLSGKTAILAPDISAYTISYYCSKSPEMIFGSPALLNLIMNNIPKNQDLSSVNYYISGGDFLTPSNQKQGKHFFREHGALEVEIGNGSGNAETVSCGTNPVGIESRPETAGKILVGTNAMVINEDTGQELKIGEEGLLCIAGKHVFKEYYKKPELTKEVKFKHKGKEYIKTGMMGIVDKDGYFTITGRSSRFYIISTLNKVYCDKVQSVLSAIDCIREVAIVQVPDDDMLFVNKAYIVLNPDINPDEETIKRISELCQSPIVVSEEINIQLKWYEIPTYIEFVPTLPRKGGTEKIDYPLLEKDAIKKLGQDRKLILKK